MNKIITCIVCKKTLKGRQTRYCSPTCKNKTNQSYILQQARGWKRKIFCVKKLGGRCSICGYNKNLAALTFHHKNPKRKNFQLDIRSLSNRRQSWIDSELKKCILVCNNCHAELHYPKHKLGLFTWAACSTTELWSQLNLYFLFLMNFIYLCLRAESNCQRKDFPFLAPGFLRRLDYFIIPLRDIGRWCKLIVGTHLLVSTPFPKPYAHWNLARDCLIFSKLRFPRVHPIFHSISLWKGPKTSPSLYHWATQAVWAWLDSNQWHLLCKRSALANWATDPLFFWKS